MGLSALVMQVEVIQAAVAPHVLRHVQHWAECDAVPGVP